MNSKQYEKEMKKVEALQRKIRSDMEARAAGNAVSAPFRAVGWLKKANIRLVIAIIVLAIIASAIQYAVTGNVTLLEFLKASI